MYHTQEKRSVKLTASIICVKGNAWLGDAHYFWYDELDAHFWGINSKKATGEYEIYASDIEFDKVLDTVFNEEHYLFWIRQINKAASTFAKKAFVKPTLKEINDYFKEKGIWSKLSGIMFQDISQNPDNYIVKEFQYKKRIQLAVYDTKIITNFAYHTDGNCI